MGSARLLITNDSSADDTYDSPTKELPTDDAAPPPLQGQVLVSDICPSKQGRVLISDSESLQIACIGKSPCCISSHPTSSEALLCASSAAFIAIASVKASMSNELTSERSSDIGDHGKESQSCSTCVALCRGKWLPYFVNAFFETLLRRKRTSTDFRLPISSSTCALMTASLCAFITASCCAFCLESSFDVFLLFSLFEALYFRSLAISLATTSSALSRSNSLSFNVAACSSMRRLSASC
mmetsp:Transcript_1301/g.1879  ORF Transcript_1301/g.1879 Transcript_1301/m.1879 type:complete len:240 (-) Transcript_1301:475-1194(-)